jgi:hypothetical protein
LNFAHNWASDLSIPGEKNMAMKLVKKTSEYSIFQRGDERYAVVDASKKAVNGDEKVRILVAEDLLKVTIPAKPAVEEPVEEETAPEAEASAEEVEEPAKAAESEAPAAEAEASEEPAADKTE